ncbi:hypothetical protein TYRP_020767 [Tyrophagus putrescentiae]|nr:hypothetical protein TYRP_020767 [Tyrophagus putrescentiae]
MRSTDYGIGGDYGGGGSVGNGNTTHETGSNCVPSTVLCCSGMYTARHTLTTFAQSAVNSGDCKRIC